MKRLLFLLIICFVLLSCKQNVTEVKPLAIELNVISLPSKIGYFVGEEIDLSGLVIEVTYDNGEKEIIDNYNVSYESININLTCVNISFEELTCSFDIIFKEKVKMPINDHLDYSDKTTKAISFNDFYQVISDVRYSVYRDTNMIIVYDESNYIKTNIYGYELAVDKTGMIVDKAKNVSIPQDGFVVSGHGEGADILKLINIGDYIIYKDNQLFLYHNEFVQPYNEVFYLFYQYLDYINTITEVDEYNYHVEKINELIPLVDEFYLNYTDNLKVQLIDLLTLNLESEISEHEFNYSYCSWDADKIEFTLPNSFNYRLSTTYDDKLYIGGFRNTNTLVYYDKNCYRERNNFGYEVAVDKNGIVVSKGKLVNLEEDGFILSGHGSTVDFLTNFVNLYDKIEIVDGKVYVYTDYITSMKYRYITLYNELNERILIDFEKQIPHDYNYICETIKEIRKLITSLDGENINFYDASKFTKKLSYFDSLLATCYAQLIEYDADLSRGMWYYPFYNKNIYDDTTLEGIQTTIKRFKQIGINEIIIYPFVNDKCLFENDIFIYYDELNNYNYGEYGNDYLSCFIEECHKEGILVNAFTQTFNEYIGTMKNPSEEYYQLNYKLEKSKGSIYYYDICNDEVQNQLIIWYKQLVQQYDFDKVEYDIIRYPSSNLYNYLDTNTELNPNRIEDHGYTKYSMNKFMNMYGLSGDLRDLILTDKDVRRKWLEFKENELINFITKCSLDMKNIKPNIKITAAVLNDYDLVKYSFLQDYYKWLELGIVDELEIMVYTQFVDYYNISINKFSDLYDEYNIRIGTSAALDVNNPIIDMQEILLSSKNDGYIFFSSYLYKSDIFIELLSNNHRFPYLNDCATDEEVLNAELNDAIEMIKGYYSVLYNTDFTDLIDALKTKNGYIEAISSLEYPLMYEYLSRKLSIEK